MAMLAIAAVSYAGAWAGATFVGGTLAASVGWTIGSIVGNALFAPKGPDVRGPQLSDLRVHNSAYGQHIARVHGRVRLSGNVIWATDLVETAHTQDSGGKGGGGGGSSTTYTYAANFAVMLCKGEACDINKIWANGKLIYDTSPENMAAGGSTGESPNIRLYYGTETQMPDPMIEANVGVGNCPAYRGLVYIVFEDLQLENYGNQIPSIAAEINGIETDLWNPQAKVDGSAVSNSDSICYVASLDELWVSTFSGNIINRYDRATGALVGSLGTGSSLFASIIYDADGYVWGWRTNTLVRINVSTLVQTNFTKTDIQNIWLTSQGSLLVGIGSPTTLILKINKGTGGNIDSFTTSDGVFCITEDNQNNYWYTTGDTTDLVRVSNGIEDIQNPGFAYAGAYLICDRQSNDLWVSTGNTSGNLYRLQIDERTVHGEDGIDYTYDAVISATISGYSTTWPLGGIVLEIDYYDDLLYIIDNMYYQTGTEENRIHVVDIITNQVIATIVSVDSYHGGGSIYDYVQCTAVIPGYKSVAWVQGYYSDVYLADGRCDTGDKNISQIITEECALVGLDSADIDVTDITDTVRGYIMSRRSSVRSNLEPLATAFAFDVTETDWKLKFVSRSGASIRTIEADDLAVHQEGEDIPPDIASTRMQDLDLPQRVDISYLRRESDYQICSQASVRETVDSDNSITIEWPMVLSDTQALHAAQTQMFEAWMARQTCKFSTTRKHSDLEPCDIVSVNIGGEYREVIIKKKEESRIGQINFEAMLHDSSVYTGSGVGDGGVGVPQQGVTIIDDTASALLDLPPLLDSDSDAGFYWGICQDGANSWSGATLFKSSDNGASYYEKFSQVQSAVIGTATTALASGRSDIFDETNTVTVELVSGELSSNSRIGVFNGANACALKSGDTWEVLQFRDATLVSGSVYTLSGLLRGRRGTEDAIGGHAVGDQFVLLGSGSIVRRVPNEVSELYQIRLYKAVTSGQELTSAVTQQFACNGRALKPYSPVSLGGGRDASGNITINWRRRSRLAGEWIDNTDVPLSEASELYDVEIWDSGYTTLKRTISGLTAQTTSYTAADQVTDFGGTQSTIYVRIYQISSVVGRGFKLEGNL